MSATPSWVISKHLICGRSPFLSFAPALQHLPQISHPRKAQEPALLVHQIVDVWQAHALPPTYVRASAAIQLYCQRPLCALWCRGQKQLSMPLIVWYMSTHMHTSMQ